MKLRFNQGKRAERGYVLLVVIGVVAIGILLYSSLAKWTSSTAVVNDRNNVYNSSLAAAEAGSETVLSYLERDFSYQTFRPQNLNYYASLIPTNDWASSYQFSDGAGVPGRNHFSCSVASVITNLNSQFPGLYGLVYDCSIRSAATPRSTPYTMAAAVQQDVQLASIPVFQFAIFYSLDLEINPGPVMKITGKVHSNANLYTAPGSGLEYVDSVTAVGGINNYRAPGDPTTGGQVVPVYDADHVGHVSSMQLPIGTNNNPASVNVVLQPPAFGENALSPLAQERYYNKTDLIITTTDTNTLVQTGTWNGLNNVTPDIPGSTNTPAQYSFIKTNGTFYDQREGKSTVLTEIDVAAFTSWLTNGGSAINDQAQFQLGHGINSIYVNDQRARSGKLTAVRVFNGRQLPPAGLTVATALPVYVQGHYNAPVTTAGSTDTSNTKAASLLGDSISILSQNWADTNSSKSLNSRAATDTTVNAALLGGIVPTTTAGGGHYSGGVENFPRFLEDWNGKTLTYNGSMVVMFASQYATNNWIAPGTYYNPPNRLWAFDTNFRSYDRLPPVTPQVRKLVRGQWNVVSAQMPTATFAANPNPQ